MLWASEISALEKILTNYYILIPSEQEGIKCQFLNITAIVVIIPLTS
jgi:hypothetical protein